MIENIWKTKNLLSYFLKPFSYVYYIIFKLYNICNFEKYCCVPVVCVGNITVGGAGKTPTVIETRKLLSKNFKDIFVLTRGYKGHQKGPLIVNKKSLFDEVGDESLLHFQYGPTCVAKNKFEGAKHCRNLGSKLIIMDDGLQSVDIRKDFRILVIDEIYGFGNGNLFPSGPLREPIDSCIEKSDVVLILGMKKKLRKFKKIPEEKIFFGQKIIETNKLKKKKLYAFSALGNNQNFYNSLKENKLKIIKYKTFPDHYIFKKKDIIKIIKEANENKLSIVCTKKDYVKIPDEFKNYIIPIQLNLRIEQVKKFKKKILDAIRI